MAYVLSHPSTGMVVNLCSSNQTDPVNNGDRLLLYSWQNNNDQKWNIEAVGNPVILRLARDTSKVLNRHSVNNNAIVWYYDGSAATKLDSLIDTETTNGNTRIKLTGRGLYLTKNAGDNYLSWTGKIESNRQYFKLVNETDYDGGVVPSSSLRKPVADWIGVSQPYQGAHKGIDYGAANGTEIKAAAAGTVIFTQVFNKNDLSLPNTSWDTMGNCMFIQHPNFGMTLYMHMNAPPAFSVGTQVALGTTIGYVGNSGNANGYHLHFGFKLGSSFRYNNVYAYDDGEWKNPANYIV